MNAPIHILNPDGLYPTCSEPGCKMLAVAGYCRALCCMTIDGPPKAYCSEHSHMPAAVLEVLGHAYTKKTYARDEVLDIVRSMWAGAGLVLENAGKFEMEQRIARERARRAALEQQNNPKPT